MDNKWISNELGYSYEQIAELSGVPLSTVQKVPVAIFKNECEIDFKEIYQYIEFMYQIP